MPLKNIAISPAAVAALPGLAGLMGILARSLQFKFGVSPSAWEFDGGIEVRSLPLSAVGAAPGKSTFHLVQSLTPSRTTNVTFTTSALAPGVYRGRSISPLRAPAPSAPLEIPGTAIAHCEDGKLWTSELNGDCRHDYSVISSDWFSPGDSIFQHLGGDRLLGLLPLVDWLRAVVGEESAPSPLRACFQFDDPNLHRSRYGFISYPQLAAHARAHRYHAAMATIPVDGYWVNGRAAKVFRDNPGQLSLLIHGNNHTSNELARGYTEEGRKALARQSLARISRLEERARLQVSRVMAAPHGACSEAMLETLAQYGYEAASISSGSLRSKNPGKDWVSALGLAPVEIIAGMPVMNRFRLRRGCEPSILLAAYLGQPIIPVGHHWDLAEGLAVLEELAAFINSLGPVSWMSMAEMARTNYRAKRANGGLQVQLDSRNATISIPDGVSELTVLAPWMKPAAEELVVETKDTTARSREGEITVRIHNEREVRFMIQHLSRNNPELASLPGTPIYIVIRRVLVEARDRVMVFTGPKLMRKA